MFILKITCFIIIPDIPHRPPTPPLNHLISGTPLNVYKFFVHAYLFYVLVKPQANQINFAGFIVILTFLVIYNKNFKSHQWC